MSGARCPACGGLLRPRGDGTSSCEGCGALLRPKLEVPGLSLETNPSSPAFAKTHRCPSCDGVMAPWKLGDAGRGWVFRCAMCEEDFIEPSLHPLLFRHERAARSRQAYESLDDEEKRAVRSAIASTEDHGEAPPPFHAGLLLRLIGLPQLHLSRVRVPIVTPVLALILVVVHVVAEPLEWAYVANEGSVFDAFTSTFVHLGLLHLIGNLYFLLVFGTAAESRLPRPVFAVWLLLGGTGAALVEGLVHPDTPILGASGSVAVALGVCFVLLRKTPVTIPVFLLPLRVPMWAFALIEVLYQSGSALLDRPGVAWFAHLGGMGAGVLLALVAGDNGDQGVEADPGHA